MLPIERKDDDNTTSTEYSSSEDESDARFPPSLTQREQQILDLLFDGCRNREIAEHLVISENTVETHLRHIFAKLGVRTRQEAIIRQLSNGNAKDHGNP